MKRTCSAVVLITILVNTFSAIGLAEDNWETEVADQAYYAVNDELRSHPRFSEIKPLLESSRKSLEQRLHARKALIKKGAIKTSTVAKDLAALAKRAEELQIKISELGATSNVSPYRDSNAQERARLTQELAKVSSELSDLALTAALIKRREVNKVIDSGSSGSLLSPDGKAWDRLFTIAFLADLAGKLFGGSRLLVAALDLHDGYPVEIGQVEATLIASFLVSAVTFVTLITTSMFAEEKLVKFLGGDTPVLNAASKGTFLVNFPFAASIFALFESPHLLAKAIHADRLEKALHSELKDNQAVLNALLAFIESAPCEGMKSEVLGTEAPKFRISTDELNSAPRLRISTEPAISPAVLEQAEKEATDAIMKKKTSSE